MNKLLLLLMIGLTCSSIAFGAERSCIDIQTQQVLVDWASGPMSKALALAMLLMGSALAITKNSIIPALSGIAMGAFMNFGPTMINSIIPSDLNANAQCKPKSVMVAQPKKEQPAQPVLVKKEESITKDVSKETQKPKIQGLDEWKY